MIKQTMFNKQSQLILPVIFLILVCQTSAATNLNRIYIDTETFKMGVTQPVLINGRLIFNGEVDDNAAIWALDTDNLEKEVLFQGHAVTQYNQHPFQRLGSDIYFIGFNSQEFSRTLWKTDGTAAGTSQISDTNFSSGLHQNNGFLFAESNNSQLLVTDGLNSVTHDVNAHNLNSTCIYDINNIIAYTSSLENKPYQQSNNGAVTTLDITVLPPTEVVLSQTTFHDGACFTLGSNGQNLWKIDASGELVSLNAVINSDKVIQLMSHQNHLYAIGSTHQSFILKRFNSDLSSIDTTYGDPQSQGLSVTEMRSLGDNIALSLAGPVPVTTIPYVTFVTSDLIEIPDSAINFIGLPEPHQTSNQLILKIDNADPTLLINPFESEKVTFNLTGGINNIVTDSMDQQIFVHAIENSNQAILYRINETPDIGSLLTGNWFNPNIESQGLNILKGTRANGSEYIAVRGYTYKDGLPFWFAGNANINYPQSNIEVELYEFSGIGMFEADNTPDSAVYGSVNLAMTSCDQLNATITTDDQVFNMLLYRIDDVTYTQNCVD